MPELILKNCTIVNHDKIIKNTDITIKNSKIESIGKTSEKGMDCSDMLVFPGLVDMHAHFREPGEEYKEDIRTGALAAAKGGYTSVAIMPNTKPPLDNPQSISYIKNREKQIGTVEILPFGAISKGMESKEITEMYFMLEEGAIGFSDDGPGTADSGILYNAMRYASRFGCLISTHCEDRSLSEDGQINESEISLRTGLSGIPYIEETIIVYRNLSIAQYTGSRLHIAHVSAGDSLDLIKKSKKKYPGISCEVTPHHLIFDESVHLTFNTDMKVKPALKSKKDRLALIKGIADGSVDAIATDHAPHQIFEKEVEFKAAPFGMIGLETALPAIYSNLVMANQMDVRQIANLMAYNPARLLKIAPRIIEEGAEANITVFNPNEKTLINADFLGSKSVNTPFLNTELHGSVTMTIAKGKLIYSVK